MSETQAPMEETRAPFTEHLRELRRRVIFSAVFIVVGLGIAWAFHEPLFDWLMAPYTRAMADRFPDETRYINYRGLIEPLVVYLKTSLLVGAIGAAPLVLHQAWLFIAPGLFKQERRMAWPFMVASIFFFVGGSLFCRYIVLDPAVSVLLSVGSTSTNPTIMMSEYFSFISRMLFVFGVLFELPVVITFLSLMRLVRAKWLLAQWRYVIVLSFVVGAMMTPPDPLTQVALALPLVVLYAISIVVAFLIEKARGESDEPDNPEHPDPDAV